MADNWRKIQAAVNIETAPFKQAIEWYAGESIQLEIKVSNGVDWLQLETGGKILFQAWSGATTTTLYVNDEGAIITPSTGLVRSELTPEESSLTAGDYNYIVRLMDADDSQIGVLLEGVLTVNAAPSLAGVGYVGTTGPLSLTDLNDVVNTAGVTGDVLTQQADGTYDLETPPGGGGGASELSDLTDVNTSTPTNRHALVADGVDFESRLLVEADISDLGSYGVGDFLADGTVPMTGSLDMGTADIDLDGDGGGVVNLDSGKLTFIEGASGALNLSVSGSVVSIDGAGNIGLPGTVDGVDVAGLDAQVTALDVPTTKGDLIAHNATVPVRLAVGTNDQVLTADSAEASGVKWADAGGGGSSDWSVPFTAQNFSWDTANASGAIGWEVAQLDTASFKATGEGLQNSTATQQDGTIQATFATPPNATSLDATNAFKFVLFGDNNTSTQCKYDLTIYGYNSTFGGITTVDTLTGQTITTADTPEVVTLATADLTSSTLFDYYTVSLRLFSKDNDAIYLVGGSINGA